MCLSVCLSVCQLFVGLSVYVCACSAESALYMASTPGTSGIPCNALAA